MATTQPNRYSSQEDIIQFCSNPPSAYLISGDYANKIVKLSDDALVKYGYCVVLSEAENQRLARERVDLDIVYIPEVYRYFDDDKGDQGYIIMELVQGEVLHSLDTPAQTEQMSRILNHLATLDAKRPGPLCGGLSPALIFGEAGAPSFSTVADLDQWANARLPKDRHVSFSKLPLALCHLDIAPENMIWRPQQPPCLIDWASAGFYPQLFEIASQRIGPQNRFKKQILSCFQIAIKEHGAVIDAILLAWFNCHRHGFINATDIEVNADEGLLLQSSSPPEPFGGSVPVLLDRQVFAASSATYSPGRRILSLGLEFVQKSFARLQAGNRRQK